MRPIKAHELSHSGAMARFMQRRAGVFHPQDSRSRLVQRLPNQPLQTDIRFALLHYGCWTAKPL